MSKTQQDSAQQPFEQKSLGNFIDVFVKRMFSRFVVFADFLLFYADQHFVNAIDLSKIEPAPTHYIGQEGDERIVDLVFQCPLKDGRDT
ncbi:MAG: Rpn family recombination-promoting nuclease/putative transposase, partial [Planctomycetaceae bacterium]|nr:Rpn family recombination-promoting nuclease/putative transposase [Planctomycetaceae bacterium]